MRARLLRAAGKLTNAGGQEVSRRQTKGAPMTTANCNATGEADLGRAMGSWQSASAA